MRLLSLRVSCAVLVLSLWSTEAVLAGGSRVGGMSARGRSIENAFTAIADDPSAIYYNPAGLVQVEGTKLLMDLGAIQPTLQYDKQGFDSSHSTRKAAFPALFASTDVLERVTFGVGVFAPFARKARYTANEAVNPFAPVGGVRQTSSLMRLDFAPSVAFTLGDDWAVGAGPTASYISANTDIATFKESLRGYGFTGQIGVLYRGFDNVQLGLSYRGRMHARVEGRGTLPVVGTDHHSSALRFPDIWSLGAAWQATDAWLFSASVDLEGWSYVKEFRRDYNQPPQKTAGRTVFDPDDSFTFHVGAVRRLMGSSELRFGYAYEQQAVPTSRIAPAQPDYRAHLLSIGLGHSVGRYDFALTYEYAHSPESKTALGFFPGTYGFRAHIVSLSITAQLGDIK